MILNYDKIKEIVTGAVCVEEADGVIKLHRFTKEQEELYKKTNQDFYMKAHSSAGIKIQFRTNSESLTFELTAMPGSSRKYFSVDVFVDNKPIGYIDNFSPDVMVQNYTKTECSFGDFSKQFHLGKGTKSVCIHLPWSAETAIRQISVDDGAFVEAEKKKNKLLVFGDSITQGYDALRPSNRYIAKIADALDAEEFNKAIGGERFFPPLAETKDLIVPDYIIVAYGTNDWGLTDLNTFKEKCRAFYEIISQNYPEAKIFAITPIWRKDMDEERVFGKFETVETHIRNAVKDIGNVTVISGFDFVPEDEKYFADLRLHPNDEGFEHYFENLYSKIKPLI